MTDSTGDAITSIEDVERVLAEHGLAVLNKRCPHWPEIVDADAAELPSFIEACLELNEVLVEALVKTVGPKLLTASYFSDPYEGAHIALHSAISNNTWCLDDAFDLVFYILQQATGRATVNTLLENGWKWKGFGMRPLHLVVAMAPRNPEVAVLLLHAGANPFLCDGKGKTARQTTSHPTESVAIALHCGELAYTVFSVGEWRDHRHASFPLFIREMMRALVVLAKTYDLDASTKRYIVSKYPQACLHLLPEELLQYLFAYITSFPIHCNECIRLCECCCCCDECVKEKTEGFFL